MQADGVVRRAFLLLAVALALFVTGVLLQRLRPGPALELDHASYTQAEDAFAKLALTNAATLPASFTVNPVSEPFVGLVVHELEQSCRGGGTYLLRSPPSQVPLLISAPHRGSDRLTGTIALQLFLESQAAAAGWNSVPRRSGCESRSSDLARLRRHPFTAFSVAFARAYPSGRVVQVHGFDPDRRDTMAGRAASIILSSGSDRVSAAVKSVADCLRRHFPDENVAVYPTDVRELGARRNAQGRSLRAVAFGGFVHAELSLSFRRHLTEDPEPRARFARCLESGL